MSKDWTFKKILLVVSVLVLPVSANAVLIYQQALNTTDNFGYPSDTGSTTAADNFTLSSDVQVQSISWFGSYSSAIDTTTTDTFAISIYENTNSTALFGPTDFATTRSDSGLFDFFGAAIYQYDAQISGGWDLSAGSYLLSVSNENSPDFFQWYWSDSLDGDGVVYTRNFSTDAWATDNFNDGLDAAFTLSGEVAVAIPEPATALLLFLGLTGLVIIRRHQV